MWNKPKDNQSHIIADIAVAPSSNAVTTPLTVETVNNHVYFYAEVDPDRCLALIRSLRDLDNNLRNERLSRSLPDDFPYTPIWLHIQSGGGDLFAAFGLVDQFKQLKTPIYSVIEGVCASAATFISLGCAKRYILGRSYMLIHEFTSVFWGKYQEFKDEEVLQTMMINEMASFYTTHSKLSMKRVREMLKHNTWLNAAQCLEHGLVDEVIA